MNKKEFFFGAIVVLLSYGLSILLWNRYLVVLMNLILCIFYCLYLRGKLPSYFYAKDVDYKEWCSKLTIGSGIFYLFCCTLAYLFPSYLKLIGRIGFFSFLLVIFCVLFYAISKKFFWNMPNSQFKSVLVCHFRNILILVSNVIIFPCFMYSYDSSSQNGKLMRETIKDGRDVYATIYVDSISNYVTNVKIRDGKGKMDYVIYYAVYPDSIDHIDTLKVY